MTAAWKSAFTIIPSNIQLRRCHAAELRNTAALTNVAAVASRQPGKARRPSQKMLSRDPGLSTLPCTTQAAPVLQEHLPCRGEAG